MRDFRIVESYKSEFYVQQLIKTTKKSGFLWWRKTKEIKEWKRITSSGDVFIFNTYFTNFEDLISFTTKEQAEKWIEDFCKYPIYYYL